MSHSRSDVVEHALAVLDRYGLADLSMRRLAGDLGVRASALYWHFPSKQALLAAVADEVLRRGDRPVDGSWDEQVRGYAHALRDAMLAYRDGGELVAAAHAFGLGEVRPSARLEEILGDPVAAATVLYFVLGHVTDEQLALQAGSAGAIDDDPLARADTFADGLAIVVAGIAAHLGPRFGQISPSERRVKGD